jgi:hypothetical protein
MKLWSEVPAASRPALFQLESGPETYQRASPATPKRTLEAKLFLYFDARDPTIPGATAINNALDAIDAALAPVGDEGETDHDDAAEHSRQGTGATAGTVFGCRSDGPIRLIQLKFQSFNASTTLGELVPPAPPGAVRPQRRVAVALGPISELAPLRAALATVPLSETVFNCR